ncbi:23S rRNA (adenine(2503)-C(2))-methyltransferase RlmN [Haloferula sp. A504]|uniref:23S rRNA (adenine(2503)-C(2))-methyltransferase RlmN n=1 Tax=Haloferula sp. A504 TaxID=3373601 RepID=UPI0031BFE89A|nr:23S rRNA (adenine(2503)-C(2))-methyltransferase RlmN [Verrucomicrobiaceae bacterium E54]
MESTDPSLDHLGFEEVVRLLDAEGIRRAHAVPLFRWLQTGRRLNFEAPLERWLAARPGVCTEATRVSETPSADGETRKFLLRLADGQEVESVLMGFKGRHTACLSTQVGCAMGCVFCATGQMGFRRHLKVGEIIAQARFLETWLRENHDDRLRNIVMMGMGEPLHNFEATMQALELLTDTRGLGIGAPRVTISTVGHVPGIRKLARHPKRYSLAVSLHGATDEEREPLVPINRRWPLVELMDACREFSEIRNQRVFIAWTLIAGVNDDVAQARRLAELLKGMDVHVNLIPLNPTDGYAPQAPGAGEVLAFQRVLQDAGLPSTIRQRKGIDVGAGCGQLATRSGAL